MISGSEKDSDKCLAALVVTHEQLADKGLGGGASRTSRDDVQEMEVILERRIMDRIPVQ